MEHGNVDCVARECTKITFGLLTTISYVAYFSEYGCDFESMEERAVRPHRSSLNSSTTSIACRYLGENGVQDSDRRTQKPTFRGEAPRPPGFFWSVNQNPSYIIF